MKLYITLYYLLSSPVVLANLFDIWEISWLSLSPHCLFLNWIWNFLNQYYILLCVEQEIQTVAGRASNMLFSLDFVYQCLIIYMVDEFAGYQALLEFP